MPWEPQICLKTIWPKQNVIPPLMIIVRSISMTMMTQSCAPCVHIWPKSVGINISLEPNSRTLTILSLILHSSLKSESSRSSKIPPSLLYGYVVTAMKTLQESFYMRQMSDVSMKGWRRRLTPSSLVSQPLMMALWVMMAPLCSNYIVDVTASSLQFPYENGM
jgi:hypothetical protein